LNKQDTGTMQKHTMLFKGQCVFLGLLVWGAVFLAAAPTARAQLYPAREVELVVPFPPGGVTDLTARVVAGYLTKKWGQTVKVVNKVGQGGTTGTMQVLQSPNSGYTMLMSATGQATQNPALESTLPYRWDEPTLVARTNVSPLVFVVKGDSPWNSVKDVMDAVRQDPTQFMYGTSGAGGVGSIAIAQLLDSAGIDPNKVGRVPLQGGAPLLAAVIEGHTHFAAQYQAEMRELITARKIKPLAVSTASRTPQLPDVPSGREAVSLSSASSAGTAWPARRICRRK
jgi:tripartite-type tricarboxylate transporter receptor subunit TctC